MKDVKKESLELIDIRYKKMNGKFPYSIKKLNLSRDFKDVFLNLKKKKYPDWVIYMAISNIIINYRVRTNFEDSFGKTPLDYRDKYFELMERVETEDDLEIPSSELTEDKIEMAIEANILSFLKSEGYEFRRATPNFKALRRLAETKYEYFKYDIPHEKWFDFEK